MSAFPLHGRTSRLALLATAVAAAVAAAALVVLPATAAEPAPAAAQPPDAPTGWLRVGHLAPAAPPVDVTLATFGGPERQVVQKAGYGAVTPYSALPPGTYTISMRPAGASTETPPELSQAVDVTAGTPLTVLVFATGPTGSSRPGPPPTTSPRRRPAWAGCGWCRRRPTSRPPR